MLKYMILVIEVMFMPAILFSLISVYNRDEVKGGLRKPFLYTSYGLILFSVIIFLLKTRTVLINKAFYSIAILSVELTITLVLLIYILVSFKKKDLLASKLFRTISTIYMFFMGAYSLPTYLLYINEFPMGETSIFSTAVLFKSIGYIISTILIIVMAVGFYKMALKYGDTKLKRLTFALVFVSFVTHFFAIIQPLLARRIIPFSKALFKVMIFVINKNYMFIYISLGIALLIPIFVWYKSCFMSDTYDNPAEHRKIKAESRRRKRWSTTIIIVFVFSILNLTVIKAYDEREIVLSPIEESVVEGDSIYIPLEVLEDGLLHRFAHYTPAGIEVRFIIIKKSPSAYGVGLDACEICGATGYYQRKNEVVCKRCDVVMNIQTIGFKGGCNPIPFEYEVLDGRIKIKKSTLEAYEDEYK